jgi:hypothetical protein
MEDSGRNKIKRKENANLFKNHSGCLKKKVFTTHISNIFGCKSNVHILMLIQMCSALMPCFTGLVNEDGHIYYKSKDKKPIWWSAKVGWVWQLFLPISGTSALKSVLIR